MKNVTKERVRIGVELSQNRIQWRTFVPEVCNFTYKSCQLNCPKQIED